jgi:hypothetical protein
MACQGRDLYSFCCCDQDLGESGLLEELVDLSCFTAPGYRDKNVIIAKCTQLPVQQVFRMNPTGWEP